MPVALVEKGTTPEHKVHTTTLTKLPDLVANETIHAGTTWNGTPFSAKVSISSPPRPKINGSPPLRRQTRLPCLAKSTNN
jgi:hypothetical protein